MKICFIDFETTGIDVFKDNPIEFGAILVNEFGVVLNEFHSYVKPSNKRRFTAISKNIHGIKEIDLINAPTQKDVLYNFLNNFGLDYRFAGWNINFDVSFFRRMCHLNNMMRDYNMINHRHLDVQTIAFFLSQNGIIPKDLNSLSDLVEFFNLKRSIRHNALEDAIITFEVYKKLKNLI